MDFMVTDEVNVKTFIDSGMSQVFKKIRQQLGSLPVSYSYSYSHNDAIGTVRIYFKVK